MKINLKKYSLNDTLPFGKYKDLTIKEIIDNDFQYLEWVIDTIGDSKFEDLVLIHLQDKIDSDDLLGLPFGDIDELPY